MTSHTTLDWLRWGMQMRREQGDASLASPQKIGELALAPFQQRAVTRLVHTTLRSGGALLADAPGLGKTRVSLSAAHLLLRRIDPRGVILCCAPARQLKRWRQAFQRARIRQEEVVFCSHTALSRGMPPEAKGACVILVDEAHRFRNPSTKRRHTLNALCARAHTLLVTATPVCASRFDLYHLLKLFAREDLSRHLTGHDLHELFEQKCASHEGALDQLLTHLVVRREHAPDEEDFGRRPGVRLQVLEYEASAQEEWFWQNLGSVARGMTLELMAPQWPQGLMAEHLLKRWESGAAALLSTLQELCHYHERWLEAARAGRALDRASFKALPGSRDAAMQGIFPFIYQAPAADCDPISLQAVEEDLKMLKLLCERATECIETNHRDEALCELIASNQEQKFLIFTEFVDAAQRLFEVLTRALGASAQVALVTGSAASATGLGRQRAEDILARFAPMAQDAMPCPAHQRIQILVATDCLAEGLNLQDCGHIILADLPYTPLAVEQRIGRLVRPGSPHEEVVVYLPRPKSWPDSLGMRRRLDDRLKDAHRTHTGYPGAQILQTRPVERAPLDPLLASERLDRWCARELATPAPRLPGHWHITSERRELALWALVRLGDEELGSVAWWRVDSTGAVHTGCAQTLPRLIALSERREPLARARPEGALHDALMQQVHWRAQVLLAAHLAPHALPAACVQVRFWRALSGYEDDSLKRRLLRPHHRGVELMLERLLSQPLSLKQQARKLHDILPALPAATPPQVQVLGTLAVA